MTTGRRQSAEDRPGRSTSCSPPKPVSARHARRSSEARVGHRRSHLRYASVAATRRTSAVASSRHRAPAASNATAQPGELLNAERPGYSTWSTWVISTPQPFSRLERVAGRVALGKFTPGDRCNRSMLPARVGYVASVMQFTETVPETASLSGRTDVPGQGAPRPRSCKSTCSRSRPGFPGMASTCAWTSLRWRTGLRVPE